MDKQEFKEWLIQETVKYNRYANEMKRDIDKGHEEQQIPYCLFSGQYIALLDVIRNVDGIVHFTKDEFKKVMEEK